MGALSTLPSEADKPAELVTNNLDIWTSAIQTKSASGRGSSKKLDLYGIKKLRELILELAVRGKLVPQDSSDEPASALLERIAAEKARLVNDKVIKKPKTLPELSEEEMPFELPPRWAWDKLGNLSTDIHYGYTASAKNELEGVRLLRITDIQNDRVSWDAVPGCEIDETKSSNYLLANDDILIARTGGTIGKSYLVENIGVKAVFASYLIRVKRIATMHAPFIKTYLGSQLYWKQLYDNASGTGQPNVNATALKSLAVSIPPLAEQHRIVVKVDELMALCDQLEQQTEASIDAHATLVETLLKTLTDSADAAELEQNWTRIANHFDTLFTTEHSIDLLKQTVLQLAVMGKLVPQDPNDEPASVLLEKIAAEKAQLIKEKKIKKQKPLPPIDEDEQPFALPEGWEWCQFGNATYSRLGKMLDKAKNKGEWKRYLRNTNVQWQKIDLSDLKEMRLEETELEEYSLRTGDLLICEGGVPGRCAIWSHSEEDIYFQKALHRARAFSGVMPEYLEICLTVDAHNESLSNLFTGATIKHLPGDKLAKYVIPLPPTNEQHRIVAKVDQLMGLCDQVKVRLQQAQQTQLHLADALVEQAVG